MYFCDHVTFFFVFGTFLLLIGLFNMLVTLPQPSSQKKPYKAPVLRLISVNAETTILSGFSTEDWEKDPEGIG